jgi:hypothetical protein
MPFLTKISTFQKGPGGSLLVPFHPFSVLVLWVFLEKIVNNQNLDAINIFSGSQIEHSWRCL